MVDESTVAIIDGGVDDDETMQTTLDLSGQGLVRLSKATMEQSRTTRRLALDDNRLQRLDQIDSYNRLEKLSAASNQLLRMYPVCRLSDLVELNLSRNQILTIEGLRDLVHLRRLDLSWNQIKSVEHLQSNGQLVELDLSGNLLTSLGCDLSHMRGLRRLSLHSNRLVHLRNFDKYLPVPQPPLLQQSSLDGSTNYTGTSGIIVLELAGNSIADLNEFSRLTRFSESLEELTIEGNPCVTPSNMATGGNNMAASVIGCSVSGVSHGGLSFDYRPFLVNWITGLKSIDGLTVTPIESLKAEWLYSQGRGRQFTFGEHTSLVRYLAATCPPPSTSRMTQSNVTLHSADIASTNPAGTGAGARAGTRTKRRPGSSGADAEDGGSSFGPAGFGAMAGGVSTGVIGGVNESEDDRKLRLVLSKAQEHQRQLMLEQMTNSTGSMSDTSSPSSTRRIDNTRRHSPRMTNSSRGHAPPSGRSPLVSRSHAPGNGANGGGAAMTTGPGADSSGYYRAESAANNRMLANIVKGCTTDDVRGDAMTRSLDSATLALANSSTRHHQQIEPNPVSTGGAATTKIINHNHDGSPLRAAKKHVPVPESLMSPDVQPNSTTIAGNATHMAGNVAGNATHAASNIATVDNDAAATAAVRNPAAVVNSATDEMRQQQMAQQQQQAARNNNNSSSPRGSPKFCRSPNRLQNNQSRSHRSTPSPQRQHHTSQHHRTNSGPIQQRSNSRHNNNTSTNNQSSRSACGGGVNDTAIVSSTGVVVSDSEEQTTVINVAPSDGGCANHDARQQQPGREPRRQQQLDGIRRRALAIHQSSRTNTINNNIPRDTATASSAKSTSGTPMALDAAALTIQRLWRGHRARCSGRHHELVGTLNDKRLREHIMQLSRDMSTTRAALESERRIRALQVQAIQALWKRVEGMQPPRANVEDTGGAANSGVVDGVENNDSARNIENTSGVVVSGGEASDSNNGVRNIENSSGGNGSGGVSDSGAKCVESGAEGSGSGVGNSVDPTTDGGINSGSGVNTEGGRISRLESLCSSLQSQVAELQMAVTRLVTSSSDKNSEISDKSDKRINRLKREDTSTQTELSAVHTPQDELSQSRFPFSGQQTQNSMTATSDNYSINNYCNSNKSTNSNNINNTTLQRPSTLHLKETQTSSRGNTNSSNSSSSRDVQDSNNTEVSVTKQGDVENVEMCTDDKDIVQEQE